VLARSPFLLFCLGSDGHCPSDLEVAESISVVRSSFPPFFRFGWVVGAIVVPTPYPFFLPFFSDLAMPVEVKSVGVSLSRWWSTLD